MLRDLNEWCIANPPGPLLPNGEKFNTGWNKGQKLDWVSKANKERVWTEEMRARVATGNKTRGAKIYCPDLNKTWDCAKDAAEELGLNWKQLYEVARGARGRKTYKGLRFERVGNVESRRKI